MDILCFQSHGTSERKPNTVYSQRTLNRQRFQRHMTFVTMLTKVDQL